MLAWLRRIGTAAGLRSQAFGDSSSSASTIFGEVAEWIIAIVLKTIGA